VVVEVAVAAMESAEIMEFLAALHKALLLD
jgi:hypothetical protein